MTHAEAGTVLAHLTGHYAVDINRPSFDEFHSSHATSCRTTLVSHDLHTSLRVAPGIEILPTSQLLRSPHFLAPALSRAYMSEAYANA
jgi:hypothetical protein